MDMVNVYTTWVEESEKEVVDSIDVEDPWWYFITLTRNYDKALEMIV